MTDATAAALGAIEAAIRATLGRPIGLDENFFDAGLTSLTLVRAHAEGTRALDRPPPVTALFAHPNLRALRRHLATGVGAAGVGAAGVGAGERRPARAEPRGARATAAERRDLRRRTRSEGGRT